MFRSVFVLILLFGCVSFAETIVVVGAGMAGLTAAYDIQKGLKKDKALSKKMNLYVYEAKDRVGGRVFTVNLNGQPAELGGQNILDGGDALTLRRLIKELGLKTHIHPKLETEKYYFDKVTNKQFNIEKDLIPYFPKITAKEIAETLTTAEPKAKNVSDLIEIFFDKYKTGDSKTAEIREIIKRNIKDSMQSYEGGSVEQLSPRYAHGSLQWMTMKFLPSKKKKSSEPESESVRGGNSKLALAIAGKIKNLNLNMPLKEVELSKQSGYELKIGSEIVHADYVVLAIPAGVYKNISFGKDTVDGDRLDQIKKISYGTHAKILAPSPSADKRKLKFATTGLEIWTTADEGWSTYYYSGKAGVMENQNQFKKSYELALTSMGQVTDLPTVEDVTVPTKIFADYKTSIGLSWVTDPYIGGSYSFYTPELRPYLETTVEVEGEKFLPLFVPINDRIYFAGEHTVIDQDIRGTMEAAAESGARNAKVLLKKLKQAK